jgi:hypothetical protein
MRGATTSTARRACPRKMTSCYGQCACRPPPVCVMQRSAAPFPSSSSVRGHHPAQRRAGHWLISRLGCCTLSPEDGSVHTCGYGRAVWGALAGGKPDAAAAASVPLFSSGRAMPPGTVPALRAVAGLPQTRVRRVHATLDAAFTEHEGASHGWARPLWVDRDDAARHRRWDRDGVGPCSSGSTGAAAHAYDLAIVRHTTRSGHESRAVGPSCIIDPS